VNEGVPLSDAELQAYTDERLEPGRRAAVEAWLVAHPEESERIADYRRLSEEVRSAYESVLSEPVPERLERVARRRARLRRVAIAAGWVALGAALGAIVTAELQGGRSSPGALAQESAMMARRAAIAHATYSPEVRHPVEVGADDEQHLVAWLSKRVGVKLRAPSLDEAGLSLVGGRLLPGESGPVAQFMYQSGNGRRLTLYIRREASRNRETAFRYARENNVGVFYWIDRETGYALASADLSREELLRAANLVYKQLEP
jgi:anti-sigma factor RsiW